MRRIFFNRAAHRALISTAIVVLFVHVPLARASAGNNALKIYEVAGAGGLAGASISSGHDHSLQSDPSHHQLPDLCNSDS